MSTPTISGGTMLIFGIRTIILVAGVLLIKIGLTELWEKRPVRRKRYAAVVSAKVVEINEERRSGSINTYFLPRFEYEEDGEVRSFMPKESYRPCRLKLGEEVTLCLSAKKGKFRTVRSGASVIRAAVFVVVGLALAVGQLM